MSSRNAIATPYASGCFGAKRLGMANQALLVLFVSLFFLPYFPETRIRADVIVGYAFLPAVLFLRRFETPFERQVLALSATVFLWSFIRLWVGTYTGDNDVFSIQFLTSLNFLFFATGIFSVVRGWLVPFREKLLMIVQLASVLFNGIAVFQWLAIDHPINAFIFQNWGGVLPPSVRELPYDVIGDISTNAEFLARIAGRYSSIFGSMYVLASFNVLIIALSVVALNVRGGTRWARQLAALAIGAAFVGGVLSASKTFYLGAMIALFILTLLSVINVRGFILIAVVSLSIYFLLKAEFQEESTIASIFELVTTADMAEVFGSRYSPEGLLSTIDVVFSSPAILFFGVGVDIGDLYLADNGYLMPIIIGGMPLALLTYAAVGLMVRENYRQFRAGNIMAAGFLAAHGSFLAAGVGIPMYQLPRVTLLFLVLNLVFLALRLPELSSQPRTGRARLW